MNPLTHPMGAQTERVAVAVPPTDQPDQPGLDPALVDVPREVHQPQHRTIPHQAVLDPLPLDPVDQHLAPGRIGLNLLQRHARHDPLLSCSVELNHGVGIGPSPRCAAATCSINAWYWTRTICRCSAGIGSPISISASTSATICGNSPYCCPAMRM